MMDALIAHHQRSAGPLLDYESACLTIANLRTLTDAKHFSDKAEGLRVYARQAKNRQLEIDAAEIRIRSERRLGELLAETPKNRGGGEVGVGRAGKNAVPDENRIVAPTLAEQGIDKKLSSRAQKLAAMPNEMFEKQVVDWRETAETNASRSTLDITKNIRKSERAEMRKQENENVASFTEDLFAYIRDSRKFGCIYADPPWLYDNQGTRAATSNHYNGLTIDELCALPVKELAADDAHLHLWTTNGFLFECPKIFEAWGFEFRSSFVWIKPQMGIGNYWRNSHEIMLTAIRGDAKRFDDKSLKSWIECDRGAHSAKPEIVRHMIEKASPPPFLELFGRSACDGWAVWGNQIERGLLHQHIEEFLP